MNGLVRAKFDMLCSSKVQLISSGVASTVLPYGNAVVKRIAVLARPWLLLKVTESKLKMKKNLYGHKNEGFKEKGLGRLLKNQFTVYSQ